MREEDAIELARRGLEREGFAVLATPRFPSIALPAWFSPDIAAVRDDHVVVVEVESVRKALPSDHLERAWAYAQAHGWEYRLWRFDPFSPHTGLGLAPEALEPQVAFQWPAEPPMAAVQLTWLCARLEAALRALIREDAAHTARQNRQTQIRWDLDVQTQESEADALVASEPWPNVLRWLALRGFVEPSEYTLVRDAMSLRDAWAHGLSSEVASRLREDTLEELGDLPTRLRERARDIWQRTEGEP